MDGKRWVGYTELVRLPEREALRGADEKSGSFLLSGERRWDDGTQGRG